ncbi:MAG: VIT family protein [Luteimonas sp.]
MRKHHAERHRSDRSGWLRAAVLGANDGIVSVAGLVVGIAASGASHSTVLMTGIAGLVAGAMSMAAGEYVSVRSQADTEQADMRRESMELHENPQGELAELTHIYVKRGLSSEIAAEVARQLTEHDALLAHARDELGITESLRARPLQAALASAGAFASGAWLPVVAAALSPEQRVTLWTTLATLIGLFVSGALAGHAGGASWLRGATRVVFWGSLAMAATYVVGRLFNAHV